MIFISTHNLLESINVSLPIGAFLHYSRRAAGLHSREEIRQQIDALSGIGKCAPGEWEGWEGTSSCSDQNR